MTMSFDRESPHGPLGATLLPTAGQAIDERRLCERTLAGLSVCLAAEGQGDVQHCKVEDISEDGLFLRLPSEFSLCVGQRCEVQFGEHCDKPAFRSLEGESRYATVVRTATLPDGSTAQLGAGLRFDQRLYF